MNIVRQPAAPSLRRLRILVAMVLAVSGAGIAAVVVLQTHEREARANEAVARVYASSVSQAIADLVPDAEAIRKPPPPVLAGLVGRALDRSLRNLSTIRRLDSGRADRIERLIGGVQEAGIGTTFAARRRSLEAVVQASRVADEIATAEHRRAERAEVRSLLGSGIALAFAVLAVFVLVFRDRRRSLSEAESLTKVARELADQDSLTALPNRRRFDADLDRVPTRNGVIEIAVCDLNGFKAINDRLGHDAGDAVLIAVARDLQTTVGDAGTVYRTGGDEFCVISEPDRKVGDLAREALERAGSTTVGSVGAASFPTDHALTREVVRLADRRMYASKRACGRRDTDAGAPAQASVQDSGRD